MNRKSNSCCYCNNDFDIYINRKSKTVKTDITADRINNDYIHETDNCLLCCVHCNISKK